MKLVQIIKSLIYLTFVLFFFTPVLIFAIMATPYMLLANKVFGEYPSGFNLFKDAFRAPINFIMDEIDLYRNIK